MKDMQDRLVKLNKIRELGVDPYGGKFTRSHSIEDLIENFEKLVHPVAEGKEEKVKISGRIIALRGHGKAGFLDVQGFNAKIQGYVKKDNLSEQDFSLFKLLDIGDIVGLEGVLFITQKGEKTVKIERIFLLSKSLRPLPEKWHGLKDVELRYRRRCLDLIVNPTARETFLLRIKIIKQIREFLEERGFAEVETPMLQRIAGGAKAKPFFSHYNALNCDVYMRIAPELYLKRLLVGGMEKVYELGRNFRNEGISTVHNPEFTMLEIYEAYADYTDMMRLVQELIQHLWRVALHSEIKLKPELNSSWQKISFYDALKKETGIDFQDDGLDFKSVGKKLDLGLIEGSPQSVPSVVLDKVFDKFVQPKLINPSFVVDYPTMLCPLAKRKKDNPKLSERFELFVCGQELANAYSELNNPIEQRNRFEEQGGEIDEDFLSALDQGMPPAAGLGIGIDRLIMLLTNNSSIREVLLFPQLKPLQVASKKPQVASKKPVT